MASITLNFIAGAFMFFMTFAGLNATYIIMRNEGSWPLVMANGMAWIVTVIWASITFDRIIETLL